MTHRYFSHFIPEVAGGVALDAVISSTSTFTAAAPTPLDATVNAVGSLTAKAFTPLNATIQITSSFTAKAPAPLNAAIASVFSLATVPSPSPLNASIAAVASFSAKAPTPLNAAIAAVFTMPVVAVFSPLNASISAQGIFGPVSAFTPLNGQINALFTLTADLSAGAGITATIPIVSSFTAAAPTPLNTAPIVAISSFTAKAPTPIDAAVVSTSTLSAKAFSPLNARTDVVFVFSAVLTPLNDLAALITIISSFTAGSLQGRIVVGLTASLTLDPALFAALSLDSPLFALVDLSSMLVATARFEVPLLATVEFDGMNMLPGTTRVLRVRNLRTLDGLLITALEAGETLTYEIRNDLDELVDSGALAHANGANWQATISAPPLGRYAITVIANIGAHVEIWELGFLVVALAA